MRWIVEKSIARLATGSADTTASWEINIVFKFAGCAYFIYRDRSLSKYPPFPAPLHPPHYRNGKKEGHWRRAERSR
jgi:hypothetical protein